MRRQDLAWLELAMPSSRLRPAALVILVAGTGLACRIFTDNEIRRERQLALVQFYHDPIVVQTPETVSVSSPFDITVRTYGGGCIDQGDTGVTVHGLSADLRPYDHFVTYLPPRHACPDILHLYVHRATLRFDEPGTATVTVHGRVRPGDSTITIQRSVRVQ
jgi:hypothetical protein